MKAIITALFLLFISVVHAQSYQGPANGSVTSGVLVSTGSFDNVPTPQKIFNPRPIRNLFINGYVANSDVTPIASAPEGANYQIDPYLAGNPLKMAGDYTMTNNFVGVPDQGFSIPPDPYLAVGPQHIMAVVNSRFRILTKAGAVLSTIEASAWFSSTLSGADPFDPKVTYDHYAKRWVMVWLNQTSTQSYFLVSVSDDSIPTGNWYNYRMDNTVNGSTSAANWSDYQGVGYDQNALYITANQFTFAGSFQYPKLRIIPKTALYANNGGSVAWTDIWDIKDQSGNTAFGIRPVRAYGSPVASYLVSRSVFVTGTYFGIYKINNPLTTPSLTYTQVPVTAYSDPDDMKQLGGTQTADGGGSGLRNEPVMKDNKIYLAHAVRSGTGNAFSSVRMIVIDPATGTATEDKAMGADGYFHSYPALEVDNLGNVILTYSRASATEYIGAFFTTRMSGQTALSGSKVIKAGAGYYYKTFGGTRNRWGDYMGIWLDPAENRVYALTEYVASTNTWGTWIGELSYSPTALSVTLTAPDGGEVWAPGSTKTITWTSTNVTNVKLEYSTDNGSSWSIITASIGASSGSYSWTVPSTPSTNCRVRVSDIANPSINDISNGAFTIGQLQAGWVAVNSGTTGDIWAVDWASPTVVWLSASNGDVRRSTDAGTTWTNAGNAGDGGYGIAAIDALTAVVALGPTTGNGAIKRTTDGGTTWTQVYTAAGAWFNFVDRLPNGTLWSVSDPIASVFHIMKSSDNGATWSRITSPPAQPATNVFGANGSFWSLENNYLWFGTGGSTGATAANRVYRSSTGVDGPWSFATGTNQFVGSMAFSTPTGNGVIGFWQVTANINKTTNGGQNFTTQTTTIGTPGSFEYLPGTNYVWAATTTGIFRSTDNGTTWTADVVPSGTANLNVLRFYPGRTDLGIAGAGGGILLKSQLPNIIPVELTSFTASVGKNTVTLSWNTATEQNNRGFEVQRNTDGSWVTLGFVQGKGTTTLTSSYSFADSYENFAFAGKVSYRLKQIDYDGRFELLKPIEADVDFTAKEYALSQNYPNPFNPETVIKFAVPVAGKVTLSVFNQLGEEVAQLVNSTLEAGTHTVTFSANKLAGGVYYYTLRSGSVSISKKLTLLK